LAPAGEFHVDVGQQPAVEQRVVGRARAKIDRETATERIETVRHSGKAHLRQGQRVDHARGRQGGSAEAEELRIQECEVERCVVRDELCVAEELQ
jgi:hypothetical protein